MNFGYYFIAHFFIASIKKLRNCGSRYLTSIGKLRVGNISRIQEEFYARNNIHIIYIFEFYFANIAFIFENHKFFTTLHLQIIAIVFCKQLCLSLGLVL